MRALLAQLAPVAGAVTQNVSRAATVVASHREADLAVFPELFASGYRVGDLEPVACRAEEGVFAPLAEAGSDARTATAIGFVERGPGGYFNAVACFDADGELAGVYRKTHLFGAERDGFHAGDSLLVVPLAGRMVAPLICFDAEFPEPARSVARAGADLLVTVAANMEPFHRDHVIACQARALENRMPHVYVNRCGAESGFTFVGGSRAVSGDGEITVEASDRDEELALADVDSAGTNDERVDYLAHERGELPVDVPMTIDPQEVSDERC